MKNNLLRVGVAVLAGSLVLTGCSRGDGGDSNGAADGASTSAQVADERIAALGWGDADTLLALGITPVAVAPWGAEADTDPSGVGPWATEMLGDAQPEKIFNVAQGVSADIVEQVTATNPDKIIAVNQAIDAKAKEELEAIAPTTVKPEGTTDWQIPWKDQVKAIAKAVGKESEGEELITKTEEAFEEFRNNHKDVQGKTAAMVMPYSGKLGLYTSGDGRGQFIENLGFEIPDELEGDGNSFFVDLAPENYSKLNDVDYLFVLDYNGAVDELKKDKTFTGLDIVKDGRVRYLDTDTGNAMSMPNPVTIPWAVDKVDAAL
ncbi:iron-siderophore ABC transporter substrate-binding protein [Corynebacterium incognita]|uniref:Iron-siderophore ABC transporter substrate-binding protein n=1 Tax=Corynebacterium incognita TaxID=2754725 RepID=A0A7G7CMN4_9CORY|nr:iron-siderophore ABC transporter substrate-binding protein [Corynebacterium incognita]QNE88850.1 iron-siderophore ABC transporter substrate-binding protein [Corynebacterium incognita]